MLLNEIAKETGMTKRAVKYYEEKGNNQINLQKNAASTECRVLLLVKKAFLTSWRTGKQAPRHGHPLQILRKSCGSRPQNLQGSDFSEKKQRPWSPYTPSATIGIREVPSPLVVSLRSSSLRNADQFLSLSKLFCRKREGVSPVMRLKIAAKEALS